MKDCAQKKFINKIILNKSNKGNHLQIYLDDDYYEKLINYMVSHRLDKQSQAGRMIIEEKLDSECKLKR